MLKRVLFLVFILLFGLTGCSSLGNTTSTPKFEIAADMRNDTVPGITPEIQEALIQAYLSDSKAGAAPGNFIKVVNSLTVEGGKEIVVRVKDGFSMFFMDSQSKKISFTSGFTTPDFSHSPLSCSVSPIKQDSLVKVFVGFFNLADAGKVNLTWSNGTTSSYELTNGTLIISPFNSIIKVKKYEIQDVSGKPLYSGE